MTTLVLLKLVETRSFAEPIKTTIACRIHVRPPTRDTKNPWHHQSESCHSGGQPMSLTSVAVEVERTATSEQTELELTKVSFTNEMGHIVPSTKANQSSFEIRSTVGCGGGSIVQPLPAQARKAMEAIALTNVEKHSFYTFEIGRHGLDSCQRGLVPTAQESLRCECGIDCMSGAGSCRLGKTLE